MKDWKKFYSINKDHYHTIYHIDDLLRLWETHKDEFMEEFPELDEETLTTAIKWHDSHYVPGDELNEVKSVENYINTVADYISEMMESKDVDATIFTEFNPLVCLVIESTKIGYNFTDELPSECKVMHDLDWSGFNDYETFKNNCEKIYQEVIDHNPFPKEDETFGQKVRRNQIEFYRKFAEKPLYLTKTFSKFNDIAKENMLKLADELENTYFSRRSVFDCTGMFQHMQPQITVADEEKFYKAIERLASSDK